MTSILANKYVRSLTERIREVFLRQESRGKQAESSDINNVKSGQVMTSMVSSPAEDAFHPEPQSGYSYGNGQP